ncbi:hypothetical protein E2C01_049474 [Portunus trituberculatus]|uniref:Uncharacterized protein n=1 Tax=Portunus trituberculatus TaxID=210409 RepID=A0A5B7GG53_PORTR|nr:hypothetical protein [Portunus trituberculatus]
MGPSLDAVTLPLFTTTTTTTITTPRPPAFPLPANSHPLPPPPSATCRYGYVLLRLKAPSALFQAVRQPCTVPSLPSCPKPHPGTEVSLSSPLFLLHRCNMFFLYTSCICYRVAGRTRTFLGSRQSEQRNHHVRSCVQMRRR